MEQEAGHKGKMVAEALLITHALEGVERSLTTIVWLVFQQERGIVDISRFHLLSQ